MPDFRDVDPRDLRVPSSCRQGADPAKLQRQIAMFGRSAVGMPPPWVYEGSDGVLVLYNGVTRATRIAKLAPGTLIRVEVIGTLPRPYAAIQKSETSPMNSDAQQEALALLAEVWALSPDVRLGQLFAHLGFLGEAHLGRGLGDMEGDELMSILYRHRAELLARLPASKSA